MHMEYGHNINISIDMYQPIEIIYKFLKHFVGFENLVFAFHAHRIIVGEIHLNQ